jgi:hypothetical protein
MMRNRTIDMAATAAPHIAGPIHFSAQLFSAYKRVIADVAIFSVRGRRRKCADARRCNADTAVNMTGGGGGARIGMLGAVPRGYMALASHSGSCEHGCGDQCSRQKFKLSHQISPLHMKKPTACGSSMEMEQRSTN